jgi:pimeloyl-ACP methyl ester carboxylesterase
MFTALTIALLPLTACTSDDATGPTYDVEADVTASAAVMSPGGVSTLSLPSATESTVTVRWTQINDGTGKPASYRLKYARPAISWGTATVGCDAQGTQIGATMSCTVTGLAKATRYDFQLMSYRLEGGVWKNALYSNIVTGQTTEDAGIWVSRSQLLQRPTSGPAWDNLLATANSPCGTVNLADQEQSTNVCIMAKALVFARRGGTQYRADVVSALNQIVSAPTYVGNALSLGRELGAYVIAADLIGLKIYDPVLHGRFLTTLRTLRTTYTSGAAASLIDCHERRPNNWGAHCGATRVAIALYLEDTNDLARAAQVFKGYLGDRASYAGFSYGTDLTWQCDSTRPVGINRAGCTRNGLSLDGVLPDDQRRGGSFTTSPPDENYVWEAMQGLLAQAVMLDRAGYTPFQWEDRALLRAARWLYNVNNFPATGDDTWQPPLLNYYFGTSFPEQIPTRPGKNVGWTDWTHP